MKNVTFKWDNGATISIETVFVLRQEGKADTVIMNAEDLDYYFTNLSHDSRSLPQVLEGDNGPAEV